VIFNRAWRKKFFRKFSIVVVPPIIYILMYLLWLSYKKRYHFIDESIDGQIIAVSWHGELLLTPLIYRKLRKQESTSAIISKHFHGELIAKVLSYLKISPLRGSSNRGAKQVLINSIRAIKKGESILLTPDGPRGPRHSMSDGAVALALRANLPIMIISYGAKSYWQLKSWDRFIIPKPFTQIDIYHQIITIKNMQKDEAKEQLQLAMNRYSI
jgi:lysophospholipid acyltransferase (LPLAT)-like uncharacterized protein